MFAQDVYRPIVAFGLVLVPTLDESVLLVVPETSLTPVLPLVPLVPVMPLEPLDPLMPLSPLSPPIPPVELQAARPNASMLARTADCKVRFMGSSVSIG